MPEVNTIGLTFVLLFVVLSTFSALFIAFSMSGGVAVAQWSEDEPSQDRVWKHPLYQRVSFDSQAPGEDSEVILYPQAIFKDTFKRGNGIIVLCDAYNTVEDPILANKRYDAGKICNHPVVAVEGPWFDIEQEYTILQKDFKWSIGSRAGVSPGSQGPYYCGVSVGEAFGWDVMNAHYKAYLYARINIDGINGEHTSVEWQWQFQVGPTIGNLNGYTADFNTSFWGVEDRGASIRMSRDTKTAEKRLFRGPTERYSILSSFFTLVSSIELEQPQWQGQGQQQQKPRPFRGQSECRIESLSALEPSRRIESEAGVTEFWDENNEQLDCAGVAAIRYVIQPRGLLLPSFHNAPRLSYIVQGRLALISHTRHGDDAASVIQRKPRLTLTRPKEPEFETAHRVRSVRVKSSAELEEEMMAKIPKFKARPVNKKIMEAPTLPALPRSTPQLPEFQEFHLKTMERANQHAETSTVVSSTDASCQSVSRVNVGCFSSASNTPRLVVKRVLAKPQGEGDGAVVRRSIGR
ncbi:hypothetical protein HHK36_031770 [Tetracentron sinense]|uniref:Glutamine synthetase n=1 Tax=Tetracentron sinense TaxID=13715 RepID=A0A834Y8G5_TETSI|nr:hypothetical protein HHK36_031770 [Tetracentron sinense]